MRGLTRWSLVGLVCASMPALADEYDFDISTFGNPNPAGLTYAPGANNKFRAFIRQMGAAITSTSLMPAETLGASGFMIGAELSVLTFGNAALPTTRAYTPPLLLPSLHLRKGLPFSFELGARTGWIQKSRMWLMTGELRWALSEGFVYVPDVSVRAHVSKLMNSRNFDLVAGGIDVSIGKQFALAGMITLTPYAGWNIVFSGAGTSTVDFRASRGLAAAEVTTDQFTDIYVFEQVRPFENSHHRFYGGFRFIGGILQVGAEISYALLGQFKDAAGTTTDVAGVLAINSTIGLDF